MPFRPMIALVIEGLLLCGCAASPWSGSDKATTSSNSNEPASRTGIASSATSEQQNLQQVMEDVRRLGESDPVYQQRVLDDLMRSDSSLWPLIVEQAHATIAYRRRAVERSAAAFPVDRLPEVSAVAVASGASPPDAYPRTSASAAETPSAVSGTVERVVQASYSAPTTGDWRKRLAAAIEALEAEVPKNPRTPAELAEHARLRMLYAAAGRREDAARPIPAAPPPAQQFLSKEFAGLTAWFDAERMPDPAARAAEAKPMLAEALSSLAESAPLLVRNMAFCSEVQSYGCVKRFDKYEFKPDQEVLLYAEVENFASEPTAKGYHTSLQSSYEVVDGNGKRIAERTFTPTEEHCQNLRRDFFIGYHVRLPKSISPGRYTLRLRIEDLKCRKVGQAAVDFEIKEAAGRAAKA